MQSIANLVGYCQVRQNPFINQETTVTNLTIAGNSNSLFDYAQDTLVDTSKQFWETESIGITEVSEITNSHDGFNEQVRKGRCGEGQ